jgi:transcription initiation factor IIF auxiliary subunit
MEADETIKRLNDECEQLGLQINASREDRVLALKQLEQVEAELIRQSSECAEQKSIMKLYQNQLLKSQNIISKIFGDVAFS